MTSDGTRTYIYDAANRLAEVKEGANTIATYECDAYGRRTSKNTSTGTVKYYYDGDSTRVLYETDGSFRVIY